MGLIIRLYNIVSPNSYTISVKEGDTPYPLDSGYTNVTGSMVGDVFTITSQHYKFNTQYWVKLLDTVTGRYIIENIYENDPIAYMDCCPQPESMTLVCQHDVYPPNLTSISCGTPVTPTPTPTPTNTPAPTATPGPTATPIPNTPTPIPNTPTPIPYTPTPTINTTVEPGYYYYAMGDCTDMRYSYTQITNTGFGYIRIPGCDTQANIGILAFQDPAHTSYVFDTPMNPCGFGQNYGGVAIARSSTEITEGTVYTIGQQCLSVVSVETQYVQGWTINLDGQTPTGIGDAACYSCQPPFTGFTVNGYSGVTCDTLEEIIVYSIFGGLTIGHVYGIQYYSGNTLSGEPKCITLSGNLGPQFALTDPANGINGYTISDLGPFILGQPFAPGYVDCNTCNSVTKKYYVAAERCDTNQYSVQLWLDNAPTFTVGDSITTSIDSGAHCWRVIQADQYKTVVYNDLGTTILSTGCYCQPAPTATPLPSPTPIPNQGNIASISASISNTQDYNGYCGYDESPYTTYVYTTIFTFKDSGGNAVIPNQSVTFSINDGSYTDFNVTQSTKTYDLSDTGQQNGCQGENGFGITDVIKIKVGGVLLLTYTAGNPY
jgi:hypothetical protein